MLINSLYPELGLRGDGYVQAKNRPFERQNLGLFGTLRDTFP